MLISVFTAIVRFYQQYISPFFPPVCRFYPSCSHYAIQSLERHGIFIGLLASVKRLARCHPFCAGGYDPVK